MLKALVCEIDQSSQIDQYITPSLESHRTLACEELFLLFSRSPLSKILLTKHDESDESGCCTGKTPQRPDDLRKFDFLGDRRQNALRVNCNHRSHSILAYAGKDGAVHAQASKPHPVA